VYLCHVMTKANSIIVCICVYESITKFRFVVETHISRNKKVLTSLVYLLKSVNIWRSYLYQNIMYTKETIINHGIVNV
jgi:hypothetical protein